MKKFIVLLALVTTTASALTLKEKKQFAEWQEYLTSESSSYVKWTKDKCGYDIPVKMEEAFVTPFMTENTNAASYCDSAREAIQSMCEDKMSKDAISKKIKSISCKLGKKEEIAYKINGSVLEFTVGIGAANLKDKTKEWLENNL
ncbi:MAG: hypothetical protein V4598_01240 [Bdellovibrionota bacterium]